MLTTISVSLYVGGMNTYWVDTDVGGMFLICKNEAGNVGRALMQPKDDPEWGHEIAWPTWHILDMAKEAEDNSHA